MHSQSLVELKSYIKIYVMLDLEMHFAYIRTNFVSIFLKDFIAMDSPLKLASRKLSRYSAIWNCLHSNLFVV